MSLKRYEISGSDEFGTPLIDSATELSRARAIALTYHSFEIYDRDEMRTVGGNTSFYKQLKAARDDNVRP